LASAEPHARAEPRVPGQHVGEQGCWELAVLEQDAFPDAALTLEVVGAAPVVHVAGPADAVQSAAPDEPRAVPLDEALVDQVLVDEVQVDEVQAALREVRRADLPLPACPVRRRVPVAPRWDAFRQGRSVAPQEGCAAKARQLDARRDRPLAASQPPGWPDAHD